jgi:hypothetical protein
MHIPIEGSQISMGAQSTESWHAVVGVAHATSPPHTCPAAQHEAPQ